AREREAVEDRAHAVLANAEVKIPTLEPPSRDIPCPFDRRVRRAREVGRATDERRHERREPLLGEAGEYPRRFLCGCRRFHELAEHVGRWLTVGERLPRRSAIARKARLELFPRVVDGAELFGSPFEWNVSILRDVEGGLEGPACGFLRSLD